MPPVLGAVATPPLVNLGGVTARSATDVWVTGAAADDPTKPALAHWNGSREVEEKIKEDLKVTIRCIPFNAPEEDGKCILTGEPSKRRVVWAKSY